MVAFLTGLLQALRAWFARRTGLEAENLLLREQLIVLRRKHPGRVRLRNLDRLMLVWLYRLFPALLDAILIVQPETVLRWHRRGFRAYWRWRSRNHGGRSRIDPELRALIRLLSRENPFRCSTPTTQQPGPSLPRYQLRPVGASPRRRAGRMALHVALPQHYV